jgi:hypothetical protein
MLAGNDPQGTGRINVHPRRRMSGLRRSLRSRPALRRQIVGKQSLSHPAPQHVEGRIHDLAQRPRTGQRRAASQWRGMRRTAKVSAFVPPGDELIGVIGQRCAGDGMSGVLHKRERVE